MSQLYKWQFKEFFHNGREKVIQLLLSEIVFLNHCLNKAKKRKERRIIKEACETLEKLLIAQQRQFYVNLLEEDYKNVILIIIQVFNKVVNQISLCPDIFPIIFSILTLIITIFSIILFNPKKQLVFHFLLHMLDIYYYF